jgi:transposase
MSQENSSSGSARRKRYSQEFKRSVVDHWLTSGKTAVEVAQEFGVKEWNLRDWKREYGMAVKPVDAPMPQTAEEMNREIRQLRKELARITMQRDILKKPWASCPKARRALSHGPRNG